MLLGAIGIFVYVGAEVAIGSLLINFLGENNIAGLVEQDAAYYVSYYRGGAMVGRFVGAAVMCYIKANKILAFNSIAAVILVSTSILSAGQVAMWSILAVGLCNSIMFPTIFSLAISDLGKMTTRLWYFMFLNCWGSFYFIVTRNVGRCSRHSTSFYSSCILLLLYLFLWYQRVSNSKVIAFC